MKLKMMAHKVGMTQIFDEEGRVIPVSVLKINPGIVIRKKTDEKDGYNALVLGYEDVKETRLRRSEAGLYKKLNIKPKKILRETRILKDEMDKFEVGQEVGIDLFKKNDIVDVTGNTKGRGFTGVMRRHGMSGAKGSHGTHEYFRHGGSIGSNTFPGRVFKGKRMPGRYGGTQIKAHNLSIVDLIPDKNLMLVKGAVPGPNKGFVTVTPAVKK